LHGVIGRELKAFLLWVPHKSFDRDLRDQHPWLLHLNHFDIGLVRSWFTTNF
jgi:hypothetical protein